MNEVPYSSPRFSSPANPSNATVRQRIAMLIGAGVGALIGAAIEVVAVFLAILSAGGGHGSYDYAWYFFPLPMWLACYLDGIGLVPMTLGLVQFPLYGAAIGAGATKGLKTFAIVLIAIVFLHGLPLVVLYSAKADGTSLEIRQEYLDGNELRVLVETSRTTANSQSGVAETSTTKGYLLAIDLAGKGPMTERTHIFGPLWDVPNARSMISFQTGDSFTKDDAEAAEATPACVFDDNGTLLRFTRDKSRNVIVRDSLHCSQNKAYWKREGDVQPVNDELGRMSEDRVSTSSRRYTVVFQNGAAECFDSFTGERKDDDWLTECFAEVRSIKDFENVRHYLTDDIKHLVVVPEGIWNKGGGVRIESFVFDGQTYNRADYGLAYSRPLKKPVVFDRRLRELDRGGWFESPRGAYSIGGELYLFVRKDGKLRLYTPDGKKQIVATSTPDVDLSDIPCHTIQHAPATNELVMLGYDLVSEGGGLEKVVSVLRWNYVDNMVTRVKLQIADLFQLSRGEKRPRSATAVN